MKRNPDDIKTPLISKKTQIKGSKRYGIFSWCCPTTDDESDVKVASSFNTSSSSSSSSDSSISSSSSSSTSINSSTTTSSVTHSFIATQPESHSSPPPVLMGVSVPSMMVEFEKLQKEIKSNNLDDLSDPKVQAYYQFCYTQCGGFKLAMLNDQKEAKVVPQFVLEGTDDQRKIITAANRGLQLSFDAIAAFRIQVADIRKNKPSKKLKRLSEQDALEMEGGCKQNFPAIKQLKALPAVHLTLSLQKQLTKLVEFHESITTKFVKNCTKVLEAKNFKLKTDKPFNAGSLGDWHFIFNQVINFNFDVGFNNEEGIHSRLQGQREALATVVEKLIAKNIQLAGEYKEKSENYQQILFLHNFIQGYATDRQYRSLYAEPMKSANKTLYQQLKQDIVSAAKSLAVTTTQNQNAESKQAARRADSVPTTPTASHPPSFSGF